MVVRTGAVAVGHSTAIYPLCVALLTASQQSGLSVGGRKRNGSHDNRRHLMRPNKIDEVNEQAAYIEGVADQFGMNGATDGANRLLGAAKSLRKLAREICAQGYICRGGHNCTSDHK